MKRNSTLKILTATLAVSIVGGGVALLNQAENKTVSAAGTFYMDTVAAVRIPDAEVANDVSGIRFYVHMDETTKTQAQTNGYGFLVFPQRYLSTRNVNAQTPNYHTQLNDNDESTTDYIEITGDSKKFYDDNGDGIWTSQAVIAPVNTENYNEAFTCVAYINDGNGGYTYATIDDTFSRTVLQVASAAYIEEEENRSALATAYGLGTTNPVQIADREDLELISAAVAAGETSFDGVGFKIMNDITLNDGYAPIPSAFTGSIDTNGVTVSGNFSTAIVEDKTVLTGEAVTETVTSTDTFAEVLPFTAGVGSNAAFQRDPSNIYNYNYKNEYRSAENIQALGITGDYQGAAVETQKVKNDSVWYATVNYSDAQIAAFGNVYSHIRFYLAVVPQEGIAQDWSVTFGNNALASAQEVTDGTYTFNESNASQWVEFNIPVGALDSNLTYSNTFKTTVLKLFNKPDTTEEAQTTIYDYLYYYVSDIDFILKVDENPTIFEVTSSSIDNGDLTVINAKTMLENTKVVLNESLPTYLTGSYTGNAIRSSYLYKPSSGTYGWSIKNTYTTAQLNKIAETYDTVKINVAIVNNSADGMTVYDTSGTALDSSSSTSANNWYFAITGGLIEYSNWSHDPLNKSVKTFCVAKNTTKYATINTWYEIVVPIADYIEYVAGNSEVNLFNYYTIKPGYSYDTETTYRSFDLYLGDVVFANSGA